MSVRPEVLYDKSCQTCAAIAKTIMCQLQIQSNDCADYDSRSTPALNYIAPRLRQQLAPRHLHQRRNDLQISGRCDSGFCCPSQCRMRWAPLSAADNAAFSSSVYVPQSPNADTPRQHAHLPSERAVSAISSLKPRAVFLLRLCKVLR